jgi:hypothetical protein
VGAWGAGSFGNDDAADWAGDLADDPSVSTVRSTLDTAASASPGDYLELPTGAEALAAAELVAAAAGHGVEADVYSERALDWARRTPELAELAGLAQRAIERVDSPNSELRALWLEDPSVEPESAREWSAAVADLRNRLARGD